MSRDLSGRDIFLASPGGLEHERALVENVISEFNYDYAIDDGVVFLARGWERVAAGLGRPQELINPELDYCDFMIVVLDDYWGSPTSMDGAYSSGSEEEFYRALELLGSADAKLRDVALIFKTIDPERQANPDAQLTKVLEFRNQVETSKQFLCGRYDNDDQSLRRAVEKSLRKWKAALGPREPRFVQFLKNVPLPTVETSLSKPELLEMAKAKADQGLTTQAERLLALAAKGGDPEALIAFAHFMSRTGRIEASLALNRQVLSAPAVRDSNTLESAQFAAKALTFIGVAQRKQGDLNASRESIEEGIRTLTPHGPAVSVDLAYAFDSLGLTLRQLGRADAAREAFTRSQDLRRDSGDTVGLAQSLVNVGRLAVGDHDFHRAIELFDEAMAVLGDEDHSRLAANALSGKGKAFLELGEVDRALTVLEEALAANQSIASSDGTSIVHGLLARAYLEKGDLKHATEHSRDALAESESSGNATGLATAHASLAAIADASADFELGTAHFNKAIDAANKGGNPTLARSIESRRARSRPAPTGPTA